jgi:hypothetical protein
MVADGRISDDESKNLNDLIKFFGVSPKALGFDQDNFNKGRIMDAIHNGTLPILEENPVGVILKSNEVIHFAMPAALMKRKRVTTRVNFSGFTGSVKIGFGIRYRAGTIKPQAIQTEVYAKEDAGWFYFTSQNVGFKGSKKHFSIKLSQISFFEFGDGLLHVGKTSKENPYLLCMTDYELPMAIISHLINGLQSQAA